MKAMVLAAGIGSRLRPLTEEVPKALIDLGGKTMLERVMERLIAAGVTEVVINAHHLADTLEDYLSAKSCFSIPVYVSREDTLLDTGGGIKFARRYLEGPEPFFVHNVDVVSDIDLKALYAAHLKTKPLVTLAAADRPTAKRLLFSPEGLLCGRQDGKGGPVWAGPPVKGAQPLGFAGIHVVSPALFPKLTEEGVFPILDAYLRLAGQGEALRAFRCDGALWHDIGSQEKLEAARRALSARSRP